MGRPQRMSLGMEYDSRGEVMSCVSCARAKSHARPFPGGQDEAEPGRFVGYDERGRAYKFLPSNKRQWISTRENIYESVPVKGKVLSSPASSSSPDHMSTRDIILHGSDPAREVLSSPASPLSPGKISSPETLLDKGFIEQPDVKSALNPVQVSLDQVAQIKGGVSREMTTVIKSERRLTRAHLKERLEQFEMGSEREKVGLEREEREEMFYCYKLNIFSLTFVNIDWRENIFKYSTPEITNYANM
jgi:hypothetical protein